MRYRDLCSACVGLMVTSGGLQGCSDRKSDSEVHRTAEFQKAALDSKEAMLGYMKTQQATKPGKRPRGK